MSLSAKSEMLELFPLAREITSASVPRYDFHMHTSWTDGANTAKEMHASAIDAGLNSILFSEHARRSSGDWFSKFADEVRALPGGVCRALVGVEVKVLDFDGALDTTPAIMENVDLLMGVVHRFPGEEGSIHGTKPFSPEEAIDIEFRLALAILDNPDVDILGHAFGMTYRRFEVSPPDDLMKALITKAAEKNVGFEINSRYHPEPWKLVEWCQSANARISLGSNAHNVREVGEIVRVLEGGN